MPTYQFKCFNCQTPYEFSTRNVEFKCCGREIKRVYTLPGISFKGKDFYVNEKGK